MWTQNMTFPEPKQLNHAIIRGCTFVIANLTIYARPSCHIWEVGYKNVLNWLLAQYNKLWNIFIELEQQNVWDCCMIVMKHCHLSGIWLSQFDEALSSEFTFRCVVILPALCMASWFDLRDESFSKSSNEIWNGTEIKQDEKPRGKYFHNASTHWHVYSSWCLYSLDYFWLAFD